MRVSLVVSLAVRVPLAVRVLPLAAPVRRRAGRGRRGPRGGPPAGPAARDLEGPGPQLREGGLRLGGVSSLSTCQWLVLSIVAMVCIVPWSYHDGQGRRQYKYKHGRNLAK